MRLPGITLGYLGELLETQIVSRFFCHTHFYLWRRSQVVNKKSAYIYRRFNAIVSQLRFWPF